MSLNKPWQGNPPRPPDYEVTLAPLNADTVSGRNDYFQVSLLG